MDAVLTRFFGNKPRVAQPIQVAPLAPSIAPDPRSANLSLILDKPKVKRGPRSTDRNHLNQKRVGGRFAGKIVDRLVCEAPPGISPIPKLVNGQMVVAPPAQPLRPTQHTSRIAYALRNKYTGLYVGGSSARPTPNPVEPFHRARIFTRLSDLKGSMAYSSDHRLEVVTLLILLEGV